MSKTVQTKKGTNLPLTNLKGKDYLMVAYRIQWMNEEVPNFNIKTTIIKAEKDESIVQAEVSLLKEATIQGQTYLIPYRTTTATKREDAKGFGDHLEKAETGAVGRALALLGFGTQFALADLDEGDRIVDTPLQTAKPVLAPVASGVTVAQVSAKATPSAETSAPAPFKRSKPASATKSNNGDI